jgi:endogenous inhibitor of DNA gyrase (YacG/DUF329 family)
MATCPICKEATPVKDFRPFCSKRCADIDLHRWLGEGYAIPAYEPPDDWSAEDMLSEETDKPTRH